MSQRWVTNKEREAMRALVASGLTRHETGLRLGRPSATVMAHTRDIVRPLPEMPFSDRVRARTGLYKRAIRLNRLFASCVAALGASASQEAR